MANTGKDLNNLGILHWNCRSVLNKLEQFHLFLDDYDIIALSETWLKPHHNFSLPGCHVIRRDNHIANSGGLAFVIKNTVLFGTVEQDFCIPNRLETQAISISTNNGIITIISIYRHPNGAFNVSDWNNLFFYANSFPFPIILGDFTSHHTTWRCDRTDLSGVSLLNVTETYSYCILNDGSPTLISLVWLGPNQAKSALDLSMVSPSLFYQFSWKTLDDSYSSDHYPVAIRVLNVQDCKKLNFFFYKFNLKKLK